MATSQESDRAGQREGGAQGPEQDLRPPAARGRAGRSPSRGRPSSPGNASSAGPRGVLGPADRERRPDHPDPEQPGRPGRPGRQRQAAVHQQVAHGRRAPAARSGSGTRRRPAPPGRGEVRPGDGGERRQHHEHRREPRHTARRAAARRSGRRRRRRCRPAAATRRGPRPGRRRRPSPRWADAGTRPAARGPGGGFGRRHRPRSVAVCELCDKDWADKAWGRPLSGPARRAEGPWPGPSADRRLRLCAGAGPPERSTPPHVRAAPEVRALLRCRASDETARLRRAVQGGLSRRTAGTAGCAGPRPGARSASAGPAKRPGPRLCRPILVA